MINCHPYNKTITLDISQAFFGRDAKFFHNEIKKLCSAISSRSDDFDNNNEYDGEMSRLLVCLAMVDSLTRHGDSIKLMSDIINF